MPYGIPYTDEERKARHLARYGTLENFPEQRRGYGSLRNLSSNNLTKIVVSALIGAALAALIAYKLLER